MTKTVTIPQEEYDALLARVEDLDDILAANAAMTGARLPHECAMRIIDGQHPTRVWREYRGFSALALAKKSGVSQAYLSEIETGKKPGSVEAYKAIAEALSVPLDAVVP
ncbi:Phage-related transcriptional regulator [uncultured Alphaproteobacteria bacterium]|uniref:Phage-related transcriptional regulator n=1 Tax=uncultured Alphaproteobacteria bacterium TaxID=91750 RepID=A0A212IW21_9PROT|nr:Phage-related transcriptional regulator [uncultured Alphaproteobacteria bacterium]